MYQTRSECHSLGGSDHRSAQVLDRFDTGKPYRIKSSAAKPQSGEPSVSRETYRKESVHRSTEGPTACQPFSALLGAAASIFSSIGCGKSAAFCEAGELASGLPLVRQPPRGTLESAGASVGVSRPCSGNGIGSTPSGKNTGRVGTG